MTELEDTDGRRHTDHVSPQKMCSDYYKVQYTCRTSSAADNAAAALALRSLRDKVPEGLKLRLQAPMTATELDSALAGMAVGMAPGTNGVILEFYRTFWPVIRDDFLIMLNQSIVNGHMPPEMTKGAISLLHKGG